MVPAIFDIFYERHPPSVLLLLTGRSPVERVSASGEILQPLDEARRSARPFSSLPVILRRQWPCALCLLPPAGALYTCTRNIASGNAGLRCLAVLRCVARILLEYYRLSTTVGRMPISSRFLPTTLAISTHGFQKPGSKRRKNMSCSRMGAWRISPPARQVCFATARSGPAGGVTASVFRR